MQTETIRIKGMTCAGCVRSVTRVLEALPGVHGAEVSLERGEAQVRFDPAVSGVERIREAIEDAGYEAH